MTSLMYVSGDDGIATTVAPTQNELGAGAVALLVAWKSKGLVRLAAAGIATWVGYKIYKSQ